MHKKPAVVLQDRKICYNHGRSTSLHYCWVVLISGINIFTALMTQRWDENTSMCGATRPEKVSVNQAVAWIAVTDKSALWERTNDWT